MLDSPNTGFLGVAISEPAMEERLGAVVNIVGCSGGVVADWANVERRGGFSGDQSSVIVDMSLYVAGTLSI